MIAVPLPSRARRAYLVVILGGLATFGPLSMDLYLPGLPALGRDFGTSASNAQLTMTSCMVGLALGQVLAGPVSDAFGRRRPLLIGIAAYAVTSLLCAAASSVYPLVGLRLIQGFAGAAGIVISRAVVRDLHSGVAAAQFYSLLMLVSGLAPILAPVIGGQLLELTSWRGLFVALAAIGFVLLVASFGLGETLPVERRRRGGLRDTARTMRALAHDRIFVGYALALGLAFGAMSAYIAGSPFVYQDINHVSPQLYGGLFGVNALGIVACGQINRLLVGRVSIQRLLAGGVALVAVGCVGVLAVVSVGGLGLTGLAPPIFVAVASIGFVFPNATALALSDHPHVAGTASAFIGVVQFMLGAAAAPLVGLAGAHSALPMAVTMAVFGIGAVIALELTRPRLRTA